MTMKKTFLSLPLFEERKKKYYYGGYTNNITLGKVLQRERRMSHNQDGFHFLTLSLSLDIATHKQKFMERGSLPIRLYDISFLIALHS